MRAYELMVIFNPTVDERTIGPSMDKVLAKVTEADGTIENVDIWGKRRLAYEIQNFSDGIYVVVNMTTTPDMAKEVDRVLNLNETVMRTKLLRPNAK
ncbi:30S ribosomal protein S6 [Gleimia hominis]|uniref:Small ribosomal subunit protein bS6 n=1 Tax=Gleimia hominis TaxID=595468 RepID=A0ABU3I8Q2_9ACTO|nr:30S ribosomal protein S6 [Gleimia hominis]MDT3766757.1 30S ribosomal protein S6 [Gleimia hominis]WIK64159.1 30S ribosomal protein S6 [Gleimia hominis]